MSPSSPPLPIPPGRGHNLIGLIATLVLGACSAETPPAPVATQPEPAIVRLAEQGNLPAIDSLLTAGAAPDAVDSCHWTPLMKAALNGHLATAQRLLAGGAEPNAEDKGGYAALMLAASRGHDDLVKLLIDQGALLDHQERSGGWTALIWAAKEGQATTVATLLARGASPDLKGLDGQTAADWARANGHREVLRLLASGEPQPGYLRGSGGD
ncbi:MAG: ankyrin repeat domain-containing protein [Gammaproteobacteria bacterium]|nr:ankyrin repeat domain-containing protein [Gammaproteobacteria bacterium]